MTYLNLEIDPFVIHFFISFLYIFFFIYIKLSKNLSAKYYQENEDYKKSLWKICKIFLKKKKKQQYGCECYKNLSEAKTNKLVEYREKIIKIIIIILWKYFNLENFPSL